MEVQPINTTLAFSTFQILQGESEERQRRVRGHHYVTASPVMNTQYDLILSKCQLLFGLKGHSGVKNCKNSIETRNFSRILTAKEEKVLHSVNSWSIVPPLIFFVSKKTMLNAAKFLKQLNNSHCSGTGKYFHLFQEIPTFGSRLTKITKFRQAFDELPALFVVISSWKQSVPAWQAGVGLNCRHRSVKGSSVFIKFKLKCSQQSG